jgi:hypothetical protein
MNLFHAPCHISTLKQLISDALIYPITIFIIPFMQHKIYP